MPVCTSKVSSVMPRSSWENFPFDKKYYGEYTWNKEQSYEGEFLRNSLHGEGCYRWKALGVYEGGFYANYKEGYAVMSYPDNSCFEGLFVRNRRFGPGIFTHSNGRQDAGFWAGEKLVRLSRSVDFIVPRLAPTSAAKIKLLQFRRLIPIDENDVDSLSGNYHLCECPSVCLICPYSRLIFDRRSCFFHKDIFERIYFLNSNITFTFEESPDNFQNWEALNKEEIKEDEEKNKTIPSHCLCKTKEFKMKYQTRSLTDVCEKEEDKEAVEMGILAYFTYGMTHRIENRGEEESKTLQEGLEVEENTKQPKLLAWNRSELSTLMLKEIFRYRGLEGKLTFNIAKLMLGARTSFRKTGEKEKQCLEFLKACGTGPPQAIRTMLCEYDISEELTDARGNNSVMFAAATDQHEIIDILLDYGADVNSFNDESLTPLNLCLLRRLAKLYNLGNWETVFLPTEVQKIGGEIFEREEWRKQVSIISLDRIFGDGTSMHEHKELQSNACPAEKGLGTKSKSLTMSEISSMSAVPMLSKSLINTGRASLLRKSASPSHIGVQPSSKTKSKAQPQVKKTEEFEKSIRPSMGSYFFKLAPEENPEMNNERKKSSRQFRRMSEEEYEEEPGEGDFYISDEKKKLQDIDGTIEKLLKRGADPNISEAPKPSIHLGMYSKDWRIANLLLSYGANPNSQLYSNEGLLTPLHVLVLSKPSLQYVDICDLLLNSGADPELKTSPEFAFYEGEKLFLDLSEGRTPLQLLCMRPDLEYADPEGYLLKIALLLAKVCNKTRFYRGYSYLALAMSFGNLKLLKALLRSKYFDPNILLGNDMGTILHILVSTDFQKNTQIDTSIVIADHLLDGKANPFKHISNSGKLMGNCIDYGWREVNAEKALRNSLAADAKGSGKKESGKKTKKKGEKVEKVFSERDHLIDHIKVIEYLTERGEKIRQEKKRGAVYENNKQGKNKQGRLMGGKSGKEEKESKKTEEVRSSNWTEYELDVEGEVKKNVKTGGVSELRKEFGQYKNTDAIVYAVTSARVDAVAYAAGGARAGADGINYDVNNDINYGINYNLNNDVNDDTDDHGKAKQKARKPKVGKIMKNESEAVKLKERKKKKEGKLKKKAELSKTKLKSTVNNPTPGKNTLESFPENLRQSILKLFGNCTKLDINELLLPYVVLRDGDLYYNVKRKGSRGREQYSLI